jgi:hypothetical protein
MISYSEDIQQNLYANFSLPVRATRLAHLLLLYLIVPTVSERSTYDETAHYPHDDVLLGLGAMWTG